MSNIINKVATALVYHLEWPAVTGAEVEAKELCSRYTVQSIANIGFGFEANTFNADDLPICNRADLSSHRSQTGCCADRILRRKQPFDCGCPVRNGPKEQGAM